MKTKPIIDRKSQANCVRWAGDLRALTRVAVAVCITALLCSRNIATAQQPEVVEAPRVMAAGPLAVTAPPAGLEERTFRLEDLEQIALSNNPSLVRAYALVSAERGNWVQVGLPPNPAWGYAGYQLGSGGRAEQHALLVDGELVTGHKLRLNRAIAEQQIARAEQNMFAQQQRVLTDVRVAFYESLLAQRGLQLAEQLLKIARDGRTTAERLFKAGETSEVDYLQGEIEVFNSENGLNAARARHFAAWQTLLAVMGVPHLPPAVLRGDLEAIPDALTWDETLARLLATSPEIGAAVANVDRARAAVARARREPVPNVKFQLGVMQDNGIGGKTDGIAQALLPLPILNRNQGAIRQAEAELMAAQHALAQTELNLQSRLAPVFERYTSAVYRVRRYREAILPAADKTLAQVQRLYAGGETAFLNLLTAQRTYFQTSNLYLQSLLDLRTSAAQIEGMLLSDSLGTGP
jgi:outer membrane protein, heavy metal efflux system